jgi:hypothetical protein
LSIFPFLDGNTTTSLNTVSELPLCKEIAWDYENDKPIAIDGEFKIVEGKEAVKVWCYKALKTKRFKHIIYSWNYGSELEMLTGQSNYVELLKSQVARYVKEALVNPYIKSISEITLESIGDILKIQLKINTIYGETEVSV